MVKKLLLLVLVGSMINAGQEGKPEAAPGGSVKMDKGSHVPMVDGKSLDMSGVEAEDDFCIRCIKSSFEEPWSRIVCGVPAVFFILLVELGWEVLKSKSKTQ